MFNSETGDVWEIESISEVTDVGAGASQAQSYIAALDLAAGKGLLHGRWGTTFEYDWNGLAGQFHLGLQSDWGERKRWEDNPFPGYDMVADFYEPGAIAYWFEQKEPVRVPVSIPQRYKKDIRQRGWSVTKEKIVTGLPQLQPVPITFDETCPLIPEILDLLELAL